jgi:predicted aldo/keto reductase-like oxidoreductase
MRYREIGRTGVEASILGFGCMRLPTLGKPQDIDRDKAAEMLHYAIDHGVTYVDTAYFYHAEQFGMAGASEPFVGEALSGGYRERVSLATKLPLGLVKTRDDMDRYLEEQLTRLRTDHVDFYLLHGMNFKTWERMRDLGVIEFLEGARAQGLIGHPAFSFHGPTSDFPRIIDAWDGWAFAQLQYNYMDTEYQAGHSGLSYAADRGLGVVVMEPLRGGKLAAGLPPEVEAVLEGAGGDRSLVERALRFVWNDPGVSLALSGMGTMEQVVENVAIADSGVAGSLSEADLAVYDEARATLQARTRCNCTACRYCMPCASGVDIPDVLFALNNATMWNDTNPWMAGYVAVGGKASNCTECGACEEICPQTLHIRDLMKEAVTTFGS